MKRLAKISLLSCGLSSDSDESAEEEAEEEEDGLSEDEGMLEVSSWLLPSEEEGESVWQEASRSEEASSRKKAFLFGFAVIKNSFRAMALYRRAHVSEKEKIVENATGVLVIS